MPTRRCILGRSCLKCSWLLTRPRQCKLRWAASDVHDCWPGHGNASSGEQPHMFMTADPATASADKTHLFWRLPFEPLPCSCYLHPLHTIQTPIIKLSRREMLFSSQFEPKRTELKWSELNWNEASRTMSNFFLTCGTLLIQDKFLSFSFSVPKHTLQFNPMRGRAGLQDF